MGETVTLPTPSRVGATPSLTRLKRQGRLVHYHKDRSLASYLLWYKAKSLTAFCHVAPFPRSQVSGLMLASHTSIRHLFSRGVSQYEKLMKKQAFLDNYRKFSMFAVSHPCAASLRVGLSILLGMRLGKAQA